MNGNLSRPRSDPRWPAVGALATAGPLVGILATVGLLLGFFAPASAVGTPRQQAGVVAVTEPGDVEPSPAASEPAATELALVSVPAEPASEPATAEPASEPAVTGTDDSSVTVPTAEEELAAQLARQPFGAKVTGNTIIYADGAAVYIAVDAGTLSASQCATGWFCIWGSARYEGPLFAFANVGVTTQVPAYFDHVGSVWNNRSGRTLMFPSSSITSPSYCYPPGGRVSSVSSAAAAMRGLFLSSYTSC